MVAYDDETLRSRYAREMHTLHPRGGGGDGVTPDASNSAVSGVWRKLPQWMKALAPPFNTSSMTSARSWRTSVPVTSQR